MLHPKDFIHPEDAAALQELEAIPGFSALMKKFLAIGFEQIRYGVNMASTIRLSQTQLPDLYRHLPPICTRLGIDEPEFYLQMDPNPNAWTFGDTKIFITITSGLIDLLNENELDTVIAHECGHVLCRHVLYHSMAQYILLGIDALGLLGKLTLPIQYAILYWQRKSELSCDRAAGIVTSPQLVCSTMAKLAGGSAKITGNVNMEEWAKQADAYEAIRTDGMWNKALQIAAIAEQNHPFAAVRVREILKWSQSEQYHRLRYALENGSAENLCPSCHQEVNDNWTFCKHCGTKLK